MMAQIPLVHYAICVNQGKRQNDDPALLKALQNVLKRNFEIVFICLARSGTPSV